MERRKKLCFVIAVSFSLIFAAYVTTSNETINKNKVVINYGDRYNKIDETTKEIKVQTSTEDKSEEITFLPVPNTNEPIVLDVL